MAWTRTRMEARGSHTWPRPRPQRRDERRGAETQPWQWNVPECVLDSSRVTAAPSRELGAVAAQWSELRLLAVSGDVLVVSTQTTDSMSLPSARLHLSCPLSASLCPEKPMPVAYSLCPEKPMPVADVNPRIRWRRTVSSHLLLPMSIHNGAHAALWFQHAPQHACPASCSRPKQAALSCCSGCCCMGEQQQPCHAACPEGVGYSNQILASSYRTKHG
jgi:hypothetical protein